MSIARCRLAMLGPLRASWRLTCIWKGCMQSAGQHLAMVPVMPTSMVWTILKSSTKRVKCWAPAPPFAIGHCQIPSSSNICRHREEYEALRDRFQPLVTRHNQIWSSTNIGPSKIEHKNIQQILICKNYGQKTMKKYHKTALSIKWREVSLLWNC